MTRTGKTKAPSVKPWTIWATLRSTPHSYVPLGENQLTLNCAANIVKFMYQRHQFNLSTDNARREDLKQRMRRELFALNENSLALMAESQINVDPEG